MTRAIVYGSALVAMVAATVMTMAAISIPDWITWSTYSENGGHYTKTIGLHKSCSSTKSSCEHFPQYEDCHGTDRYFCSMWRSVGFMMSFAALFELVTLVAFVVVLIGGRQKRETGWKVLCFLLVLVGALQCASMSIVSYLFDYDDRFFVGWKLDKSWILCTVSFGIATLSALFISLTAYILPSEGGYEFLSGD